MRIINFHILFSAFLSMQVFSQKQRQVDSLEYFYSLDTPSIKRYEMISQRVFSLLEKGSDAKKYILDKNYSLALETNDLDNVSNAVLSIGSYYLYLNNDAEALRYYFKALKGYEATENKQQIALALMSIGQVYKRMEDHVKSFDFINRSLQLKVNIGEKDHYYYGSLIHLANAAIELKDYDKAFKVSKISLEYFKEYPFFRIYLESNLGYYYQELFKESKVDSLAANLNIKNKQQLLDSSFLYYKGLLKTASLLESKEEISKWKAYANYGLGEHAYLNKRHLEAIRHLELTTLISQEIILPDDLLKKTFKSLYLNYLEIGDFEKALINYQSHIAYRDKIQSDENKKALFKQNLVYEHEKELNLKEDKIEAKNRMLIIVTISFIVFLIMLYLLIKKRRLLRDKKLQKQFSQKLLINQEQERKRISEDLHDGLGQSLLLVKNQLTIKDLVKCKELIDSSIEEMRTIVKTLYPFQLSRVGISTSLENLIIQLDENYQNIDLIYDIEDINGLLTIDQETNVFRIVQECLSNIIKHANADSAKVSLYTKDNSVILKVQDNGQGFDVAQKRKELKTLGLKTINERVELLKGTLNVSSRMSLGTSFDILFPITT